MPRVLIFGAGGVGGIYAYVLDKSGCEVTAVCRSNYAAVKQDGFSISSELFGNVSVRPRVAKSTAEISGDWDFVVVCSKVIVGVTPSTPDLIAQAIGSSTAIVLAQNGIGIEDEYVKAFPNNTVISGVVYLPTTQDTAGKITMGNLERLEIGTCPCDAPKASKDKAEQFSQLFSAGGATCHLFDDIQVKRWSKLMVNASWNPICALTRLDDASFIRSSDGASDLVKQVMLEVVALAQAKGYSDVNEAEAEWQYSRAKDRLKTGGIEPSMLTDVKFGRPLEVEGIIGNTTRIARDLGIKTPLLDLIYALASGLNRSLTLNNP